MELWIVEKSVGLSETKTNDRRDGVVDRASAS